MDALSESYIRGIEAFDALTPREVLEKRMILQYIKQNDDVLWRSNLIAHMTSSAMIFNHSLTKVLMIYHNIYKSWSWTGGHADGDPDLIAVAMREANEETGINDLVPVSEAIISLDVLTVPAHEKKGLPVSAHLHLSVCYGFIADEAAMLRIKPDENSTVGWIPVNELERYVSEADMIPIYEKIIARVHQIKHTKEQ